MVIPADLIVSIVGGIAAGRVVHDDHAAEFKKGAAHTGYIPGIDRYFSENLSHFISCSGIRCLGMVHGVIRGAVCSTALNLLSAVRSGIHKTWHTC